MAGVMLGCTGNVSKLCSPFRIVETAETAVPVQVMTFHVPILESLGVEPRGVSPSDLTPHKIVHNVPPWYFLLPFSQDLTEGCCIFLTPWRKWEEGICRGWSDICRNIFWVFSMWEMLFFFYSNRAVLQDLHIEQWLKFPLSERYWTETLTGDQ